MYTPLKSDPESNVPPAVAVIIEVAPPPPGLVRVQLFCPETTDRDISKMCAAMTTDLDIFIVKIILMGCCRYKHSKYKQGVNDSQRQEDDKQKKVVPTS